MRSALAVCTVLLTSVLSADGLRRSLSEAVDPVTVDRPARPTKAPVWAAAYMVEYTVSMPDMFIMQPQGFTIPVKAWYDCPAKRSRVESFGGVDTVLVLGDREYSIHPRIDRLKCWAFSNDASDVSPVLPDITAWDYVGTVTLDGRDAYIWRLEERQKEQVSTYNFYTSAADGAPLKLHMFGSNLIEGSHFDEYIYDFKSYAPFASGTSSAFQAPDLCAKGEAVETTQRHWLARQSTLLFPGTWAKVGPSSGSTHTHSSSVPSVLAAASETVLEAAYALWAVVHGRAPARDDGERSARLARFRSSAERVAAHNAQPDRSYTMQLGRFADWSEEEYLATLMPDAWRRKQGLASGKQARRLEVSKTVPHAFSPIGRFKPRMNRHELPRHVDWRGTGADAGVKDQGFCGSCWAFAATGAMEAAWFLATGERASFSEQQLVDCAFDWGVDACDGGDAEPAINFVASSGGIAIEQDYFYLGAVDYCRASSYPRAARFSGFLEVEPRNELALMEAVATLGPVAVAVDASADSFGFYKEGVYSDPQCSTTDLDHAVMLYGYGTSDEGTDYWLIKNSWSKLWGMGGFIRIVRGKHDCGISTQGAIAVISTQEL